MNQLLLATRNSHKVSEIREILHALPVALMSLVDYPEVPEVVEDGATFRENALKKAKEVYRATAVPTLADDSGLEVYALQMRPGVFSARFAGGHAQYEANNLKLLAEMRGLDGPNARRARFRCVMAFVNEETEKVVDGICEGMIITVPRGEGGFGYDPLFVPRGFDQTFAEMPPQTKNRISHRARALDEIRAFLEGYFRSI